MLFFGVNLLVYSQSKIKSFKKLSCPEKWWVVWHPFVAKKAFSISQLARQKTDSIKQNKILKGKGNGDQVDAFRHAFWMAKLTNEIGWRRAKSLGKAHEKGNYKDYKKRRLEDGEVPDKISSDMDYFNNDVGIALGKNTNENLANKVVELVKMGKCKIIKTNDEGDYVDCDGNVLFKENLKGKWKNDKCLVWSDKILKKVNIN